MNQTAQPPVLEPSTPHEVLLVAAEKLGAYQRRTLSAQRHLQAAVAAVAGSQVELGAANLAVAEKDGKLTEAKRAHSMTVLEVESAHAVTCELKTKLEQARRDLFTACAFGSPETIIAAGESYGAACKAYMEASAVKAQAQERESSARREVQHHQEVTDLAKVERSRIEERRKRHLAWHQEAMAQMPMDTEELLRLQQDLSDAVQRMAATGYIDTFKAEITQLLPIVLPENF